MILLLLLIGGFITQITLISIISTQANVSEILFAWGLLTITLFSFLLSLIKNNQLKIILLLTIIAGFALGLVGAIGITGFNDFNSIVMGYAIVTLLNGALIGIRRIF